MLRRPVAPSPVAVSPCCSSVAACRLPAHSLLLGRSSLPFASVQSLTPSRQLPPNRVAVSLCCSSVAASLPIVKTFKILGSSFHQRLWPQAFVGGLLTPAVCFHRVCCSRAHPFRLPAFTPLKCFAAGVLPVPSVPTASAASFYFISFFSLTFCRERANVSSRIVFPTA